MSDDARPRRWFSRLLWAAFALVAVLMLAGIAWTHRMQRELESEHAVLVQERIEIETQIRTVQKTREGYHKDKTAVARFLHQCRSAEDIPDFGGKRIISELINSEVIHFYLPEGEHFLKLKLRWQAGASGTEDASKPEQQATRVMELRGGCGYRLEIVGDRGQEGEASWILHSSDPAHLGERWSLPIAPIRFHGASWGSQRTVAYPNAVDAQTIRRAKGDPLTLAPLRLGRTTKRGRLEDKQSVRLTFESWLYSNSPPVMNAIHVETLAILNSTDSVGEYLGDGHYSVQTTSNGWTRELVEKDQR